MKLQDMKLTDQLAGHEIAGVELAGLPAPPTSHTLYLYPSTLLLPFPSQIILLET